MFGATVMGANGAAVEAVDSFGLAETRVFLREESQDLGLCRWSGGGSGSFQAITPDFSCVDIEGLLSTASLSG
jgi:hypothetical protein